MACREAIAEVFQREPRVLTSAEVVAKVEVAHPAIPWKRSTIKTMLIALSVNHTSAHHYTDSKHAFLFSLGGGRFRPWNAATHGPIPRREQVATTRHPRWSALVAARPAPVAAASGAAAERASLIRRLVDELHQEPFEPKYRRKPYGDPVTGWPARLLSGFWPHPVMDLRATAETLAPWFDEAGALSRRLLSGTGWGPEERRRAAVLAWSMLTWGGVTQQVAFSEATVEAVFRRALDLAGGEAAPMNSSWTKVAALATAFLEGESDRAPHVIWDSRVSTSIVWRLDRRLAKLPGVDPKRLSPGLGVIGGRSGTRPRALDLRWAYPYGRWWGQEAGSAVVREMRDILNEGRHGWMPLPDGGEGPWTIRGVESVLFMDGY